ncbi:MAG: aspartate 1-decarboxylase [bacterium]
MYLNLVKSKIHRVTVTEANLEYIGSITIDEDLMDAANIYPNERVQVVDNNNGNRFETYVIKGERGSGVICVNGAAAHLVEVGDTVIIMAYTWIDDSEARDFKPAVVFPDTATNRLV